MSEEMLDNDDGGVDPSAALVSVPYFLGSVGMSLGHLPQWYQLLSFCGVLCVIHLRNNAVITWLVVQLHSSTGTEAIWVDEYKTTLRSMSFTERLCFTLYGVTLAALAVGLFRVFCRDSFNIAWNVGQLFPDKRLPTAVVVLLMCAVDGVRLRSVIVEVLNTPGSLANLALHNFTGLDKTDFDPSIAESNPHFVIQFELMRSFAVSAVLRRLPVMILAGAYRLFRDAPRKAHVALRWYMATFAVFFLLEEMLSMYLRYVWTDWSSWAMVLWAVVFLGIVNYIYGPSKRAGTVETISATNCVTEALCGLVTCGALWFIVSLVVLAFVVSVHEELVLIWLFISLMILWVPAIIDSCSTDYMVFLSLGAAAVQYAMDENEDAIWQASARFGVLIFLWWLLASLIYNATLHLTYSRYAATAVATAWFLWCVAPPSELWENPNGIAALDLDAGHGIVHLFTARILWLRDVAAFRALPCGSWMYKRAQGSGKHAFDLLLHAEVVVGAICIAISSAVHYSLSTSARVRWQQKDIVSVTPPVLLRKLIRTAVVAGCIGSSTAVWWVVRLYVLPMWTQLLPDFVAKGVCTIAAVTTLGNLMDMQDGMYDACMRIIGLQDPSSNGDGSGGGGGSVSDEATAASAFPRTSRTRVRDHDNAFS